MPRQVGISLQFFRISAVDDISNTFSSDFLLYSKWLAPEHVGLEVDTEVTSGWHPHLKFRNAMEMPALQYERAWVHHIAPSGVPVVWKYQRFQGDFFQHMDLRKFPFDTQNLIIIVDSGKI